MFESMSTEDKIALCDEQVSQVDRNIYSYMLTLGLDPDAGDATAVTVDSSESDYVQSLQQSIIDAVARRAFIVGIKTALSA